MPESGHQKWLLGIISFKALVEKSRQTVTSKAHQETITEESTNIFNEHKIHN